MKKTLMFLVMILLLFSAVLFAEAATIKLGWDYTQNPNKAATGFRIQRCVRSGQTCNMADLGNATQLPLTPLTYDDATVQANVMYCYQVAAINATEISTYSNTVCGGVFHLAAPTSAVILSVTP